MKPIEDVRIEADWLHNPILQQLFEVLTMDGGEALIVGGAIRNTLLGANVNDVDLCTTLEPEKVVAQLEKNGIKAIPTGITHGTITAVKNNTIFEITTLREDIETDGRHAVVRFGKDWFADARRRDLTINGLYCDREGRIFDPVNGYHDILAKKVRFIGDPAARIHEDALRILRFFRFFAWYGTGRPDPAGLKACAAHRNLLSLLSAERVWYELRNLLCADDPARALLWMRTTGILATIMPETEKWGIDALPGLLQHEDAQNLVPDPFLRIMAMIPPKPEAVIEFSTRLKLSGKEKFRLLNWAKSTAPAPQTPWNTVTKILYRGSQTGILDAMRLEMVHLQNRDKNIDAQKMLKLIMKTKQWVRPRFCLTGSDLLKAGMKPGPDLGATLCSLENIWVESGFSLTKTDLLKRMN